MATPTTLPAAFTTGQILTSTAMNNLRGAFRVLQVVSTTKTDTFSTTSTTFTDVTGLTATITPSSTSNRVLIVASLQTSGTRLSGTATYWRINGGNSTNFVGDTAGSRVRTAGNLSVFGGFDTGYALNTITLVYLDTPSTTSATTYAVQTRVNANTSFLNRSAEDGDSTAYGRGASTITVMEISA